MKQFTHGSLFAGIGGFDLGFERAGFKTVWQVEIDPFCRKLLGRHFPDARRYCNVRRVKRLQPVDVVTGGFPCQDVSIANPYGEGLSGKRSGLWFEYLRIIRILRPQFVVVENVANLLNRGMGAVLGGLADSGYDCEWVVIPAFAVGAPHIRERVWIIAYPQGDLRRAPRHDRPEPSDGCRQVVADTKCSERRPHGASRYGVARQIGIPQRQEGSGRAGSSGEAFPHTNGKGLSESGNAGRTTAPAGRIFSGATVNRSDWWTVEPDVGRVAHGVPARVDRLKGLGNAVVPQIAEWIAHRIKAVLESESERKV